MSGACPRALSGCGCRRRRVVAPGPSMAIFISRRRTGSPAVTTCDAQSGPGSRWPPSGWYTQRLQRPAPRRRSVNVRCRSSSHRRAPVPLDAEKSVFCCSAPPRPFDCPRSGSAAAPLRRAARQTRRTARRRSWKKEDIGAGDYPRRPHRGAIIERQAAWWCFRSQGTQRCGDTFDHDHRCSRRRRRPAAHRRAPARRPETPRARS